MSSSGVAVSDAFYVMLLDVVERLLPILLISCRVLCWDNNAMAIGRIDLFAVESSDCTASTLMVRYMRACALPTKDRT